jgi:membrane protein
MPGAAIIKNPRELLQIIKETYADWSEDKASRLAAALAYYTAFSVAPLLLLSITVAGIAFGREAAQGQVFGQLQGLLGPEAAETVQTAIANSQDTSTSTISAIIGILTLLWSASNVFAQLQDSLNTIWEVAPDPNAGIVATVKRRFFSMTMVLGIGFMLLVSLALSAGVAAVSGMFEGLLPGGGFLMQAFSFILSFAVVTGLFAAIYKILPDATIEWSDVWVGAVVTALLFAIGKLLIGLYLGYAGVGSTFGAAGSLLVFLVWVYYSAQILFFGAEFTQVYARRYGSRIRPSEDAVAVTEEARGNEGVPRKEALQQAGAQKTGDHQPVAAVTLAAQSNGQRGQNDQTGTGTEAATQPNGAAARANNANGANSAAAVPTAATAHTNGAGTASGNGQRTATKRKPRGSGGVKGAPDAVKKVMWAGLTAGSIALGAVAARRASAEIWRGILHEDPPTKNF